MTADEQNDPLRHVKTTNGTGQKDNAACIAMPFFWRNYS